MGYAVAPAIARLLNAARFGKHARKGEDVADRLRLLTTALALALVSALPATAQQPAPGPDEPTDAGAARGPAACGGRTIAIARMVWPSAQLLAAIHTEILEKRFGCKVEVQPGDMAATVSAMATTGEPAVAPEVWTDRIADIWNQAIKSRKVRPAATSYTAAHFEGWYVPTYLAEAHPELEDIAGLVAHPDWLAAPGVKPRFLSCPADWACALINRNLLKAFKLDGVFDVVTPKTRFELDKLIAEAVGRKEPFVFYYWQPNAALAQFGFTPVDLGPYNRDAFACLGRRDCPDPAPSAFAPEPVLTALSDWVYLDAPEIAAYFQSASMPITEMNKLLERLDAPGATVETVADWFYANRAELWRKWVGAAGAN